MSTEEPITRGDDCIKDEDKTYEDILADQSSGLTLKKAGVEVKSIRKTGKAEVVPNG